MIKSLDELVNAVAQKGKRRIIIAYAQDSHSIQAADMAIRHGIADITLVGDEEQIAKTCREEGIDMGQFTVVHEASDMKCVEKAIKMIHAGEADVLMKGLVSTDKYMRGILNKEWGLLPPKATLSHVAVFEIPAYHKLLTVGDVAVIPAPDLNQKIAITKYIISTAKRLGVEIPKVACIAPSEQMLPKIESCVDSAIITCMGNRGQLGTKVDIEGPLSLDIAIDAHSAETKKLESPVAGDADCLLFPNIETGNVFYKTCTKFAGAELGAMVAGTKVPCVLCSRGDSTKTKLYSMALACLSV
ncbi:MAG: phosphate butyryltransferase [Tidjanibacter sp.]|nr:phosphate butyryltransferase [Tidjanibacter sp.]